MTPELADKIRSGRWPSPLAKMWVIFLIGGSIAATLILWIFSHGYAIVVHQIPPGMFDVAWAFWLHPFGLLLALLYPLYWVNFFFLPALVVGLIATRPIVLRSSTPVYLASCMGGGLLAAAALYSIDWKLGDLAATQVRETFFIPAVAGLVGGCTGLICGLFSVQLRRSVA